MPGALKDVSTATYVAIRGLSIDLEVGRDDRRIHRFAAVRGDTGKPFIFRGGDLQSALKALDRFAEGSEFLLGHNLVAFDAPHLKAADPGLRILDLPFVDTLQLNPLAFPRNPYHHLVKHYQDGGLRQGRLNDPELDARLALQLFLDQQQAFSQLQNAQPDYLTAWHWLTTSSAEAGGLNALFTRLRQAVRPSQEQAMAAIRRCFEEEVCRIHCEQILGKLDTGSWPLSYVLAWLSVAGGNSVMPPWVRHQFPEAVTMVRRLRDSACTDPECAWCRTHHDPKAELKRWFGFAEFRPEPKDQDGHSLQQAIVEAAMAGQHVLGILPTGTGKSLCYQVPALSRYEKTGDLTVVISPLVALMADQVTGLEARGITSCAALNGLLSMPERADVLDRVRLGDISMLIVSPEQLRSRALRRVLEQRRVGGWVLDEAHCLSKWGHDFRPDYRYIGRFIRERSGNEPVPPVLCLTATAKPEVIADIRGHFQERLGIELMVFDGGTSRENLDFAVIPTTPPEKFAHIYQVIAEELPEDRSGGAIVYCATRRNTEELSEFLCAKELSAAHFHAGLPPETKKSVQKRFIEGELRVIVATNAFGMGIDKPDVRLVIHADIPGSLENYLQEAGRAGRDRAAARCVLLYAPEDVEKQFGMSARSRLTQREIKAILRSLRRIDRKKRLGGEVIATSGEILTEEDQGSFVRDSATDDTRVRTAVAWLEEARLLSREENRVTLFPSSLRVTSVDQARERLGRKDIAESYRQQLLAIVAALIEADPDEGVSTDELMGRSGLTPEGVRKAMHDLEEVGIATNDTALTAFVHQGVEQSSDNRLEQAMELEQGLIAKLQEMAPDLQPGDSSPLHLRPLTQALKDEGLSGALPERVRRILKSLSKDGEADDQGKGSIRLKSRNSETVQVTLLRDWQALSKTADLRRRAAQLLLGHLLAAIKGPTRGVDLLAETTLGKLRAALTGDMLLTAEVRDFDRLLDHALLWLHEQEIIRLNKGLAVFRPAMTIRLNQEGGGFLKADFEPLQLHYSEQTVQIHVMAEYAQRGLQAMADSLRLAMDYFTLDRSEFLDKWLPGRKQEIYRQTLPETWQAIVGSLNNPVQQRIVADDREQTNVLVLAGPGSGKTKVLVHRIAYLVRVRRENPRGILALAYNRHAAVEIRERLANLIGDDARWITVLTCHGLAMRLTGHSFAGLKLEPEDKAFEKILREAASLLRGEGLPPEDAVEQHDRLLAGFRWILVDEYQDVEAAQYELIAAIAGRSRQDDDSKLSLFAVGDDDQNIYSFAGASVEYIRRFEQDYAARPALLTENYRSTKHIINVSNLVIEPAHDRMKSESPIRIDHRRIREPAGGPLAGNDPISEGRVQLLDAGPTPLNQAIAVMTELQRLSEIVPEWSWSKTAVIARNWDLLQPIRCYCELNGIPVQSAAEKKSGVWRFREFQALLDYVRSLDRRIIDVPTLRDWADSRPNKPNWDLVRQAAEDYALEVGELEFPLVHFIEWLAEWCQEVRVRQTGLLLLSAHRAKGLEFDHVAILDGNWDRPGRGEDPDAPRRLYYVAMTRARKALILARMDRGNRLLDGLPEDPALLRRALGRQPEPAPEMARQYRRLSLTDVDLSFAGRYSKSHRVHRAIGALAPGDPVLLRHNGAKWELLDTHGQVVGRLSKSFSPPRNMCFVEGKVVAVVTRVAEDSDAEYRDYLRADRWEVVLPELVFEPVRPSGV